MLDPTSLPAADRFGPADDNPYWNESVWFSLSVPEQRIHGMIQYYFRPNMGLLNGGPGPGRDLGGTVDHPGDRAAADAGARGDLVQRRSARRPRPLARSLDRHRASSALPRVLPHGWSFRAALNDCAGQGVTPAPRGA